MQHSSTIGEIALALATARPKVRAILKDRTGQVGNARYQYATLDSVIASITDAYSDNQLAVIQATGRTDAGDPSVTTMIVHSSGEWFRSSCSAPAGRTISKTGNQVTSDVQEIGKVYTYLRRYALCAMCNVTADEDMDASRHQASERITERKSSAPKRQQAKREQSKTPATPASNEPTEWTATDQAHFQAALSAIRPEISLAELMAYGHAHGWPDIRRVGDARRRTMLTKLRDGLADTVHEWGVVNAEIDAEEAAERAQ